MKRVLVVLPARNERETALKTAAEVKAFLCGNPNFRFLVVDDCSTDGTPDLFEEEFRGHPGVGVLRLPEKRGKGGAVAAGFSQADEDLHLFTDGDMAYPFVYLTALVRSLEDCDVAIGTRGTGRDDKRGINRRRVMLGKGFNRLVCRLLGFNYPDTQAGIKGFRREAAAWLFEKSKIRSFSFDVELLYLAKKKGLRVGTVPVHTSQVHNYTRSKVRLIKDSLTMFGDVLRVLLMDAGGGYV